MWEAPTLARCIAGVEVAFARVRAIACGKLGPDSQQRGEASRPHQIPPMVIDAILKTRITAGIRARQALKNDRSTTGEDQPVPDQQNPALAEGHIVIILPDDAGALRDQKQRPGRAVIGVVSENGK